MLNSKKAVKRILKILCAVVSVIVIYSVLNFLFVPVMYGHWANHDRKIYNKQIDTIFLGDSCVPYLYDPEKIDEYFNCCSYNAGTSAQPIEMTYFILKDFIKTSPIKSVVFSIDFFNFLKFDKEESLTSYIIALDRIKNPIVKFECTNELVGDNDAYKIIFPSYFYNEKNLLNIPNTIKAKTSYAYLHYKADKTNSIYCLNRGYLYTDETGGEYHLDPIDMKKIDPQCMNWFIKIIDLCKKNNIDINVVHPPFSNHALSYIKNREFFNNEMQRLSKQYGFKYYDFNEYALKSELNEETDFKDPIHLNTKGSEKYMKWLKSVFG